MKKKMMKLTGVFISLVLTMTTSFAQNAFFLNGEKIEQNEVYDFDAHLTNIFSPETPGVPYTIERDGVGIMNTFSVQDTIYTNATGAPLFLGGDYKIRSEGYETIFKLKEKPAAGVLIAESNFPNSLTLNNKDEWRQFWDDFGIGRIGAAGGQFTSSPITVSNGILNIPFQNGDWGGAGWQNTGAIIYNSKTSQQTANGWHTGSSIYVEYDFKFGSNFDFGAIDEQFRGGKFGFSLTVGNVGVGGKPPKYNWQFTTMWRGGGLLDLYFYNHTQSGNFPDRIIYFQVNREQWYKMGMNVVLNDPGVDNGRIEIYIDGNLEKVIDGLGLDADGIAEFHGAFGSFFGGDSNNWRSRTNSNIQYTDIRIFDGFPGSSNPNPPPAPQQESDCLDFTSYNIPDLNNENDFIRTVFPLSSAKMDDDPNGVRLTADVSVPPYNEEIRAELRETDITGFPADGTTNIYQARFHADQIPELYGPVTLFQRFNRDQDGPDIEVELTGANQFGDAVPNELQVVAFGTRHRLAGKFLNDINDLKVVVYNEDIGNGGEYAVLLNGETLIRAIEDTRASTAGSWSQFGIYPHGLQNAANRADQISLSDPEISAVWEFYCKSTYLTKVIFDTVATVNLNSSTPNPPNPFTYVLGDTIDTGSSGDQFFTGGNTTNPSSTVYPYQYERYGNMEYDIPVPAGDSLEIELFFMSQYDPAGSIGDRLFNIYIEGVMVENQIDIVSEFGHRQSGTNLYKVLSDGDINIRFEGVRQNALINGIAIRAVDDAPENPEPCDEAALDALQDIIDQQNVTIGILQVQLNTAETQRDQAIIQRDDLQAIINQIKVLTGCP